MVEAGNWCKTFPVGNTNFQESANEILASQRAVNDNQEVEKWDPYGGGVAGGGGTYRQTLYL